VGYPVPRYVHHQEERKLRSLVTGGSGFLGSHLVGRLLSDGHDVVALDNFVTGRMENLSAVVSHPNFSFVEADLCLGIPVEGRFDRIFNLASPASPIDYVELPFETLYVGSDGTRHNLRETVMRRRNHDDVNLFIVDGIPPVCHRSTTWET
jgi:nucleoside-diphosphate-sugar epimerase